MCRLNTGHLQTSGVTSLIASDLPRSSNAAIERFGHFDEEQYPRRVALFWRVSSGFLKIVRRKLVAGAESSVAATITNALECGCSKYVEATDDKPRLALYWRFCFSCKPKSTSLALSTQFERPPDVIGH
jgi:hypothetical protein